MIKLSITIDGGNIVATNATLDAGSPPSPTEFRELKRQMELGFSKWTPVFDELALRILKENAAPLLQDRR